MSSVPLEAFRPVPKARRSYVYIVADYAFKKFKVGHAVRPRDRFLRMLRTYPKSDLHLVAAANVPTHDGSTRQAELLESHLQMLLSKHKQGNGDWFHMEALGKARNLMAQHIHALNNNAHCMAPAYVLGEAMQPFGRVPTEAEL